MISTDTKEEEQVIPRISKDLGVIVRKIKFLHEKHYGPWYINVTKLIREAYKIATEVDRYSPKEAFIVLKNELIDVVDVHLIKQSVGELALEQIKGEYSFLNKKGSRTNTEADEDEEEADSPEEKVVQLKEEVQLLRATMSIINQKNRDLESALTVSSFATAAGEQITSNSNSGAPGQINLLLDTDCLEFLLLLLKEAHKQRHYETELVTITYLENMFARLLDSPRKLKKKTLPST